MMPEACLRKGFGPSSGSEGSGSKLKLLEFGAQVLRLPQFIQGLGARRRLSGQHRRMMASKVVQLPNAKLTALN